MLPEASCALFEPASVKVKMFPPRGAIEQVTPTKTAGRLQASEGTPVIPPTSSATISAVAVWPRFSVRLEGETVIWKSGDKLTEGHALISALASTDPRPVARS